MKAIKLRVMIERIARVHDDSKHCDEQCQFKDGKWCRLDGAERLHLDSGKVLYDRSDHCIETEALA